VDVEQLALAELLGDDCLCQGEIVIATLDPLHEPAADVAEGVEDDRRAGFGTRFPFEPGQAVVGISETDPHEIELTWPSCVRRTAVMIRHGSKEIWVSQDPV